jgi:hypothetical protein
MRCARIRIRRETARFDKARIIFTLVTSQTNRKEVIQCLIVYRRKARLS